MDFEKYKNTDPCPEFPKKHHLDIKDKNNSAKLREHADAMEKFEADQLEWRKKQAEWNKKSSELELQFKIDAFEELRITNNPKANLLYSKAYNLGHSSGNSEIWNYMLQLVDLIQ